MLSIFLYVWVLVNVIAAIIFSIWNIESFTTFLATWNNLGIVIIFIYLYSKERHKK